MSDPEDDVPILQDMDDDDWDHQHESGSGTLWLIVAMVVLLAFGAASFAGLIVYAALKRRAAPPRVAPPPPRLQPTPRPAPVRPRTAPPQGGRIAHATLTGPRAEVGLPLGEPAIVNVWLQACSDCMPSFNRYRDLRQAGELDLGVPVVNVAYGRADLNWAKQYGVDEELVIDRGAALVNPHGIRTFTTLVVDADGTILYRGEPRAPDYLEQVRAALAQAQTDPLPVEDEGQ